jgi:hypothetical protein
MKISRKWKQMADIYKRFSIIRRFDGASQTLIDIWDRYDADRDYSEDAMLEAYRRESFGDRIDIRRANGKINGYIEGKQWMDLTITEYWLPDLDGHKILFASELYNDLPQTFLNRVLPEEV